jgi:hypothetical protein
VTAAPVSTASGGLVTSINKVKPPRCVSDLAPGEGLQFADSIEVDRVEARCTRLRKNLGIAAKHLSQGDGQSWMVTLTYRGTNADWRPSHIRDCLRHARQWAKRLGFPLRYLWVIETKPRKSGEFIGMDAPHYHVVLWLPKGMDCPFFDAVGWWSHGMTNVVKAVAPVRYVMKYVSKFDGAASFPKGARCYGVGGISDVGRRIRRWVNWPAFVQARASVADTWRRATGGGWLDAVTGEWLPSEWGLQSISRTVTRLVRIHDHGRPIPACGPFNWNPNLAGVAAAGYSFNPCGAQ